MNYLISRSKLITVSILMVLSFIGCSQDQASLQEPIDSMNVDGKINDLSNTGGVNGVTGQDGSMSNSSQMKQLEDKLNVVNFEFDQFEIEGAMGDKLTKNGELLNSDGFSGNKIKLEGNCDEWGSDEYNYALGLKRAKSTKEYLVSEGVDKSRISIISFGESNPTCQAKTKSCWYKNRRVDTKLLP